MTNTVTMSEQTFTVTSGARANLGNCYNSQEYIITSTEPFGISEIDKLREMKIIGYGQEYRSYPRNGEKREWIVTDFVDSSD